MAAYAIADVDVKNPEAYAEYRRQVMATVEKHGGRFLARGGAHETLEGKWRPHRLVIVEFADMKALKAWYGSKDYGPLIKLRQAASEGSIVALEGA